MTSKHEWSPPTLTIEALRWGSFPGLHVGLGRTPPAAASARSSQANSLPLTQSTTRVEQGKDNEHQRCPQTFAPVCSVLCCGVLRGGETGRILINGLLLPTLGEHSTSFVVLGTHQTM